MTQDTISTNPPAAAAALAPRTPRELTRLQLTPSHVAAGVPGDVCLCAAAIALAEALGLSTSDHDVWVSDTAIEVVSDACGEWWAATPAGMADFLSQFDALDIIPVPSEGREWLAGQARDGLLQWQLTWHEGRAPVADTPAEEDT